MRLLKLLLAWPMTRRRYQAIKIAALAALVFLLYIYHDFLFMRFYVYVTNGIERDFPLASRLVDELNNPNQDVFIFKPKCDCRSDVMLKKNHDNNYDVLLAVGNKTVKKLDYSVSGPQLQRSIFTCTMNNVLRHGPGQRVVSYSLYGKNEFYYRLLKDLVAEIRKKLPGWRIRIYYDHTIKESLVCEMECGHDDEIVEMCDVEQLPYDSAGVRKWNASYMHGMSWRWLPIGDEFVDRFSSRDTDSAIIQREIDSLNVWIDSKTTFHVMRDNPQHNIPMLGGMWGFYSQKKRNLARHLLKIITNPTVAKFFNPGPPHKKNGDQLLLTAFVSGHMYREKSTIHDAYCCKQFGGEPWPTKRTEEYTVCFVGCPECCNVPRNESQNENHICPSECRPVDHQDWIYC